MKGNLWMWQESLWAEKEKLQTEREDLWAERKNLQSERDTLWSEWDTFQSKLDSLQTKWNRLQSTDIYPLEADAVSREGKLPLQRWFDARDKEMDCYGNRHLLFERMHPGGHVTWPHFHSWRSKPRAWSWESQVYTKFVAYVHKDCTRKVRQYISSNVWQRAKKTLFKWAD